MIIMQGRGVSAGIAGGKLHYLRQADEAVAKACTVDFAGERERLMAALEQTASQLRELAENARHSAGEEAAALFEAHALLALDEDFTAGVLSLMTRESCSAAWAVRQEGGRIADDFAAMDDPYLRERAADIRDVSARIVRNLLGTGEQAAPAGEPVIIAAEDLAPSQTIRLDSKSVLAFVTRRGSANSHTAILARTMGIPAVCGLSDLSPEQDGRFAVVDGTSGRVTLSPDEAALAQFRSVLEAQRAQRDLCQAMRGLPDEAPDGRRIDLCCNIASPEDVPLVLENDGRGVGLMRSEFLFLASDTLPDEETQYRAYRKVAEAMQGRRVVIRTMDVGADKQSAALKMTAEENPALGMRGVRVSLNSPEAFRVQLRALYRASAHGRVAIMFPMITSVWEVQACKRLCREVMAELEAEGTPFCRETELGVMIETPAAVLTADALAREVDFFSVGTNDLTQYTLACDRQAEGMERFFDPQHPAVLLSVRMAAEAAHRAGIWIGVCGELAAEPSLLPAFLDMGVEELSVSPAMVLPLRAALRGQNE